MLPGDGGSVNEQEPRPDGALRVQRQVEGVHHVFGTPGSRRVLTEHDAQVRATLALVEGEDLNVLDVWAQVSLARV